MIQSINIHCPACLKSFHMEGDCFEIGEKISCFRCDAELEIIAGEPIQVRLTKSQIKKNK